MFGYAGKDLSKVRSRVGCLIEAPGVYPNMTAKENIEMKCRLFGISKKGYAEGILDKVGLLNVGKKKTKNFSLGMKQRLGIGMADRKSTRLNSSHTQKSRMPSSA